MSGERQAGAGAVGLLAAVAVLGVLSFVVLRAVDGGTGTSVPTLPSGPGSSAPAPTAGAPAADTAAAARIACVSDYQEVSQADAEYQVEKGFPPTALSALASMLSGPVTSPWFNIEIGVGGVTGVATTGHPFSAGDSNCAYAGSG